MDDSINLPNSKEDTDVFTLLEEATLQVLKLKETFFLEDGISNEASSLLNQNIEDAKKLFEKNKSYALSQNKALYWFLLGRMLNASPVCRAEACEYLVKSVKLDPDRIEGWNELGECYLCLGDFKVAAHCFKGAIERKTNKVSLRNMSMVCRKEALFAKGKEREKLVLQALEYAKDSLNLDPSDGESWAILGNSYLGLSLAGRADLKTSNLAINAYKYAEKNGGISPVQYFNLGVALLFCENYLQCLKAFEQSLKIDASSLLAEGIRLKTLKYLDVIQENIVNKGKLSKKKIKLMKESLKRFKPQLGPNYNSTSFCAIDSLRKGNTADVIIVGGVIWSCQVDVSLPFTFGILDMNGEVAAVTVYNLASGRGVLIGDTVAITKPIYAKVDFMFNDKTYLFEKIRIQYPIQLCVNNKFLTQENFGVCSLLSKYCK